MSTATADLPLWLLWSLAGALMVIGGALALWALFGDRSRGRRRCRKCWYDMSGVETSLRCPECGHEARSERDLRRARRRKTLAVLGIIIALALPTFLLYKHAAKAGWVYLILPKWKVIEHVSIQGFDVDVLEIRNPQASDFARKVRVQFDGSTLLEIRGFYFSIGAQTKTNGVTGTIGLGDDITGDGRPDLVIIEDAGGTGCVMTAYVFRLDPTNPGPGIWPTAVLDHCGRFEDVDGDGTYEFIVGDRVFSYKWTSGAASPRPEVILRYVAGRYAVAINLMRKPAPSPQQLIERLHSFSYDKKPWPEQEWSTQFAALLHVTLDLIYTGTEEIAWDFFDHHWPEGEGAYKKGEFVAELKAAMSESPFAAEIRGLNANDSIDNHP